MSRTLFAKYIWLLDTIKSRGRISLRELNELWGKSSFAMGEKLSRRTFYNYRQAIEETFNITIECDPSTFEYYISAEDRHGESVTDWMLNSAAISDMLTDVSGISDRVFFEEVPSARRYMAIVLKALREYRRLTFDYSPYSRSKTTPGVVLEPYFLKIFKQRWYVTGFNVKDCKIKTYALDRMSGNVTVSSETFVRPSGFDPAEFCTHAFGIVFSLGEVKEVQLRADTRQAKYLRTLPLHHTQKELVHDDFSVFTYNLRLTDDFVQEILSHGPGLTVINPPELKAMVVTKLKETLANYEKADPDSPSPP